VIVLGGANDNYINNINDRFVFNRLCFWEKIKMRNIVVVHRNVMIDLDDISSVKGYQYCGEHDEFLSNKYFVRIFSKTPFIDLVCETLEDAQRVYRDIMKERKIVSIDEIKYDL